MGVIKNKPKVIHLIADLFFAICVILHIIVNVKWQMLSIAGYGYYIVCLLFIIFSFRPIKLLPEISAVIIGAENIFASIMLYNMAGEKYNEVTSRGFIPKSRFEIFFYNCEGRYTLAIMLFFIIFILELLFVNANNSNVFSKVYPYIVTIMGLALIGFSAYELLSTYVDHHHFYLETLVSYYPFEESDIIWSLIHMILLFIGATLIAASYCNLPNIKKYFSDITDSEEIMSSYEIAEKLKGYHDLLDKGIITQDEYEQKKDELL